MHQLSIGSIVVGELTVTRDQGLSPGPLLVRWVEAEGSRVQPPFVAAPSVIHLGSQAATVPSFAGQGKAFAATGLLPR